MGMCPGDKRVLVVQPSMGYGDRAMAGKIPGGSVLVFEVELVSIQGVEDDGSRTVVERGNKGKVAGEAVRGEL